MATQSNTISSTTQQFLDIYDITNDMLIMKDGSTSLILTVDAMNFGLLAEEEQDAIMYAYAGLLNSLNYPIQIVIRSQTKDATNYLNLLRDQEARTTSELKKQQIQSYREFVGDLIRERNVLDKKFYIVIPASSLEMGLLPPQTVVPGVKQIDVSTVERSVILEKATTILDPKRDHLIGQFGRIGLYARQLNTQEIIQLFYTSYNPEAAEGQQITHTNDYTSALVSGQTQMTDINAQPNPVSTTPTEPVATPPVSAAPASEAPNITLNGSAAGMPNPNPTPAPMANPTPAAPVTPTAPTVNMSGITTSTIEPVSSASPSTAAAPGSPTSSPITAPGAAPAAPGIPPAAPAPTGVPDPTVQEAQNLINTTAQQLGGTPAATPTPANDSTPAA